MYALFENGEVATDEPWIKRSLANLEVWDEIGLEFERLGNRGR